MPSNARDAILAAIDSATDGVRDADPATSHGSLSRTYRRSVGEASVELVGLLEERLVDYGVDVHRLDSTELTHVLGELITRRRLQRIVLPGDFPDSLTGPLESVRVPLDDVTAHALDAVDAAVTLCAVAVAETGTIMLDGGVGQGERALTLVPDTHICIVNASQIVWGIPEATERLAPAVRAGAPITWVSGPSATSDIELVRVAGVHGPRNLIVLLVTDT